MITDEYLEQNRQLHKTNEAYGVSGRKFAKPVQTMCRNYNTLEVLDYGCGKGTLGDAMPGYVVRNYDPAMEEFSTPPEPAHIVVCTDVMEHIEFPMVDRVLDDIKRVMLKAGLFSIANRPAKKFLPDGRNAHLIQESFKWWIPRIWDRFNIIHFENMSDKEYLFVVEAT